MLDEDSEFALDNLPLTTAQTLEGFRITKTIDIISAECALGMDIFSDFLTSVSDFTGMRSGTTQDALRKARRICLSELRREAKKKGANAVIAVDLVYSEFTGKGKSMLFLVASGTAVITESISTPRPKLPRPTNAEYSDPSYRFYLANKYGISRNENWGGFVVGNELFSTSDSALEKVHQLELNEMKTERLGIEQLKGTIEQLKSNGISPGNITDADIEQMFKLGIQFEGNAFVFQSYRYEKLADAVSYASSQAC